MYNDVRLRDARASASSRFHQYPGKTWTPRRYPQAAMSVGDPGGFLTVRFVM